MRQEGDIRQEVLKSTLEEVKASADTTDRHDPCVICLDSISERAIASPCRHNSFDFLCLVSWLQEQPKCPLCKANISTIKYDWRSSTDFKIYNVPSKEPLAPINNPATLEHHRRVLNPIQAPRRRRTFERANRPRPPPNLDTALVRRREVYRRQLYSSHVGSNRLSRFRDLTPQLFSQDEGLVSRARKWIRRELQVFEFLNSEGTEAEGVTRRANNAEFLLEYIVAILKTVDMKGSGGQAEDMLQEFLGRENTRLFLHELRAWLRSPYVSLEDWDRHVQYNEDPMRVSDDNAQPTPCKQYRNMAQKCRETNGLSRHPRTPVARTPGEPGDRYVPYRRRRCARPLH